MEVDNSITITTSSGTMPINTGSQINGQIGFTAPNGNVVAAGMRFGDSGPVNVIPISGAQGQTTGTLTMPFTVSASTCNNLATVCHDIKCYEYAITSEGKISQANIRDVAIMCGNCDEPSCVDLIDPPCETGGGGCNGAINCYSSSVHSASGIPTGNVDCTSILLETSGDWRLQVYVQNGVSPVELDADGQGDGYITLVHNAQPVAYYISGSGTGTWSGNTFSFNCTMIDNSGGTTPSFNLTGSLNCE